MAKTDMKDQGRVHAGTHPTEERTPEDFYMMSDPFEVGSAAATQLKRSHRMNLLLGAIVVLLAAAVCVYAFTPVGDLLRGGELASTGEDGLEKNVMITGLAEQPFTLTQSDLAALPTAAETVEGYDSLSPDQAAIYELGPTLATLAEAYGHTLSEYAEVCFVSNTTYSVGATEATLGKDLVLTLRTPDGPLPEKYQPIQVILPENDNQNWAFGVISIDFSKEVKEPVPEIL